MESEMMLDSWQQQLEALYAERELLAEELGVTDAEGVIMMVRNFEAQLADLYRTYGNKMSMGDPATMQLLAHVQELSHTLDGMYSEKSLTFELDGDKPVLKATWKETSHPGDSK
ncbi:MAG: hypothetical protein SFZ24_12070 [Planctomycetota bacterium]|nr:hypothetical protein [Planctomycetota bacterium]